MIRRKKILIAFFLICATALTITVAIAQNKPDAAKGAPAVGGPPPAMPVVAVPATKQDLKEIVSTVGSLLASESAEIRSEIAGKVEKINFVEGAAVKKGDILLEIDSSLIRTELSKAQAAYRVASSTLNRDQELRQSKYISAQELDQSRSLSQQQKSEVDSAQIRLDRTQIKAPFDGVAGLRNFSVGDYIDLGRILTTVDAYDPIKIEFSVPERNFSDVHVGQKISFTTDAWRDQTFEGEVYALDSRINSQTRSFNVKALASNTDNKLRAGMFARIAIETATKQGVVMIPEESISSSNNTSSVYVVIDGKAVPREITIGQRQKGMAEITQGLQEGDMVITAGGQRIRPGMDVKISENQNTEPAKETK